MTAIGTEDLIERLAADARPARRLWPPYRRLAVWLALALLYVAGVAFLHGPLAGERTVGADMRMTIEAAATLATAATAAIAAFASIVPGRNPRLALLPVAPLLLWLGTVGEACIADGVSFLRPATWAGAISPECLAPMTALAVVPALALAAMLRRGAGLTPRRTAFLAALAVAGLVNFGLLFFHDHDAALVVLVSHLGTTLLFVLALAWTGPLWLGRNGWQPTGVTTA